MRSMASPFPRGQTRSPDNHVRSRILRGRRLLFATLLAAAVALAVACSNSGREPPSRSPTAYVEEPHGGSGCLCDAPPDPRFLKIDPAGLQASGSILWGWLDLRAGPPTPPEEREQAWFGGSFAEGLDGEAAAADPRIPLSTSPILGTPPVGRLYGEAGDTRGATASYLAGPGRVLIGWTRGGQGPLTIQVGDDLLGVRQEVGAYHVRVNGVPGLLEEWSSTPARGGNMFYSIVIVWVDEDRVIWTVMAAGLRAEDALEIAQSIRPTQTR
jgi:hypothetical protein